MGGGGGRFTHRLEAEGMFKEERLPRCCMVTEQESVRVQWESVGREERNWIRSSEGLRRPAVNGQCDTGWPRRLFLLIVMEANGTEGISLSD